MYEHMTYERLLDGMLAGARAADPALDTREGSLIHAALAPAAAELAQMYIELDNTLNESFADTQSLPFLIRRAAERGLTVKEAVPAVRLGLFDADVPPGARFKYNELYFKVIEKLGEGQYALECETPGGAGNNGGGELTPCDYVPGLKRAELSEPLSYGSDAEGVEQLRRRYFLSLEGMAFGGNTADYTQKVGALRGVGGVRVTPAWNGGGTVLLTITDSGGNAPPPGLVAEVQQTVDPRSGEGAGIAPIGHFVTVRAAAEMPVSLEASFHFKPGYDWVSVRARAEAAFGGYLAALRERWADEEETVVRVSAAEQRMLALPGILDVTGARLNGVFGNLTVPEGHIPVSGGVAHV